MHQEQQFKKMQLAVFRFLGKSSWLEAVMIDESWLIEGEFAGGKKWKMKTKTIAWSYQTQDFS